MQNNNQGFSLKHFFYSLTIKNAFFIILVFGIITFFNSLFNGFVWDDLTFILNNTDIQSFNLTKLFGPSLYNSGQFYRPLQAIYATILYGVSNEHALFYHLTQVGLHIVFVMLLFLFFKYFVSKPIALLLALIFLVHPIIVESVSYISAINNELFSLPGLIALLLLQRPKLTKSHYVYIAFLLLLSLFGKEEGILYVFLGIIFIFLFRKENLKYTLFYGGISVSIYALFRFFIGKESITNFHDFLLRIDPNVTTELKFIPIANLSIYDKLLTIPAVIFYYLKTFFYPIQLAVNQIWVISQNNLSTVYVPLILDIVFFTTLISIALYLFKTSKQIFKIYIFFFIWFCVGLFFHLPIIIPVDMTVADRWFYFPIIGMLGMIGVILSILPPMRKGFVIGFSFAVLLLCMMSIRSIVRNANFTNNIILYAHDSQFQQNYMMEGDLGEEYLAAGNFQASLTHLKNADNLYRSERTLYDLGFWNEYQNNVNIAVKYYTQSLNFVKSKNIRPSEDLYERLSYTLLVLASYNKAEQITKEGLNYFPNADRLWYQLAICEYQLRNQADALTAVNKAKTLNPSEQYNALYTIILNKQILPPAPPHQ